MSPVPPITTIFMTAPFIEFSHFRWSNHREDLISRARSGRVRGIGVQISNDHPAVCLEIALGDGMTDTPVMRATFPSSFITPPQL
jgi:hypothetical protein